VQKTIIYSVVKFAEMIGVTKGTLRNWKRTGKLIPLRTSGNQKRYTQEQYNEFMQYQKSSIFISILAIINNIK
jgi:DNA-binding transcriptional MerR regulator